MATSNSSNVHSNVSTAAPGIIANATALAKNVLGLLICRLELVALESAQLAQHLQKLIFVFALSMLSLWFALTYVGALIVYLSWDSLGWKILALLSAVFVALALGLLAYCRHLARPENLTLPATMAQLEEDREML